MYDFIWDTTAIGRILSTAITIELICANHYSFFISTYNNDPFDGKLKLQLKFVLAVGDRCDGAGRRKEQYS